MLRSTNASDRDVGDVGEEFANGYRDVAFGIQIHPGNDSLEDFEMRQGILKVGHVFTALPRKVELASVYSDRKQDASWDAARGIAEKPNIKTALAVVQSGAAAEFL